MRDRYDQGTANIASAWCKTGNKDATMALIENENGAIILSKSNRETVETVFTALLY